MPGTGHISLRQLLDLHHDADPFLNALVGLGSDAIAQSTAGRRGPARSASTELFDVR
jgi:hypothetical protein